jgi:hypothetical protein
MISGIISELNNIISKEKSNDSEKSKGTSYTCLLFDALRASLKTPLFC